MSIISEALKKAQQEKNKDVGSIPTVNLPLKGPKTNEQNDNRMLKPLIIILALTVLAGFYFLVLPKLNKPRVLGEQKHIAKKANKTKTIQKEVIQTSKPATKPQTRVQTPVKEEAQFELSGILFDGESSMAIINGSMVRKGTRVGKAEVTTIEPQQVKLNLQGKEIILTLPK